MLEALCCARVCTALCRCRGVRRCRLFIHSMCSAYAGACNACCHGCFSHRSSLFVAPVLTSCITMLRRPTCSWAGHPFPPAAHSLSLQTCPHPHLTPMQRRSKQLHQLLPVEMLSIQATCCPHPLPWRPMCSLCCACQTLLHRSHPRGQALLRGSVQQATVLHSGVLSSMFGTHGRCR